MRCISLFAVAVVLMTGCHLGPRWNRQLELLSAEKRWLEDELYSLQYDLVDAARDLKELKRENEALRGRLGLSPGDAVETERGTDSVRPRSPAPALTPPVIGEGDLQEPRIEIPQAAPAGGGEKAREELAPPPSPPGRTSSPPALPRRELPSPALSLDTSDPRITHIHLNPLLTGGGDFDREPGDDGVVVVIEPRNQDNAFVPMAGPVSVVLLDPTQEHGDAARFARWEIDAPNAQRQMESSGKLRGIHLRLPWPQSPPRTTRMQLFVRYITVDGRKLEANREIYLSLPGQTAQRWTPRPPRGADSPSEPPGSVQPAAFELPVAAPHASSLAPVSSVFPVAVPEAKAPADELPSPPEWRPVRE
jgi:hypothetical protein